MAGLRWLEPIRTSWKHKNLLITTRLRPFRGDYGRQEARKVESTKKDPLPFVLFRIFVLSCFRDKYSFFVSFKNGSSDC
jgi:hypothetical protein